jgi:epoxyqueuosine reductase
LPSKAEIKAKALALGFDLAGVAPLGPFPETEFYSTWLSSGFAGEMTYLERQAAAKLNPQSILPGAKSIIVCAMNYNTAETGTRYDKWRAWISRYAWGDDYHDTLRRKLQELAAWMEQASAGAHQTKTYVDTGPLLERVYAKYAGVGWFGKNTCIINQQTGSWLFLGCILTDLELDYDTPVPDRCGTCTRCIDACPTQAIVEPYVLDSRKCIAYTTIELRGEIPEADREGIGHHLFGCDICQDVCPWNRKAPHSDNPAFAPKPGLYWPGISSLLDLSEDEWRRTIRGTPMKRAKIKGLLRNLMIVAGNSRLSDLVPKLHRFLNHDDEHVRSHAEWAVKKLTEQ